jgi:hypothetical protein
MNQVWLCGNCHSLNAAAAKRCYKCRTERAAAEVVDESGAPNAPGARAVAPRDPSLIGGILVGLIAAVAVTALWYWVDIEVGRRYFWLSWFVGAAIGVAVMIGGRGRTSFPLVLFSVVLTALALTAGEYLLVSHVLAVESGQLGARIPLAQPQDVIDYLPTLIEEAPLRPVLWLIALATSFLVPWRGLVGD